MASTILLSATAFGQSFTNALLLGRVDNAIDRPLPAISEILGGEPGLPAAPLVAIGYLDNSDPNESSDWGGAIGWYLMEVAGDGYGQLTIVPSYQYASDGSGEPGDPRGSRRAELLRVASRTGARFGLTGSIAVRDNQFDLSLELLEFPGNRRLNSRQKTGELGTLSLTVQVLAQELLAEAVAASYPGVTPVSGVAVPGELKALATVFGKAKGLSASEQLELYEAFWREHRNFASVATLYLIALESASNPGQIRAKVSGVLTNDSLTLNSRTFGYLLQSANADVGIDAEAVSKLAQIVLANPNSVGAWLALSSAYINENVMYREQKGCFKCTPAVDHHLGYAKAIALELEVVRRWPDHYRGWWGLRTYP